MPSDDRLSKLPKALLHDHLDGGLRPDTILDLADDIGYEGLPAEHVEDLRAWFDQSGSGSLPRYLEAFEHTVSVMQTREALERVTVEALEDLAIDGVIYAELRFAPSLHTRRGLTRAEVVEAICAGLARGRQTTGIVAGVIVDAMRQSNDSDEVAEVALAFRDRGVVAFDLAGPERSFPADLHLRACRRVREANLGLTIHAGEADGPHSVWMALQRCGAHRVGHGVRIIEDAEVSDDSLAAIGPVATYVRDHQVPLEICIASNLDTGGWDDPAAHPVGLLHRSGFNVTLNTDNRLMSATSMTDEFELAVEHHGFEMADLRSVTERAIRAGFCPYQERWPLLEKVAKAYGP